MVSPFSDRISRVPPYSRIYTLSTSTGLSPSMVYLSMYFLFLCINPSAGPISLATTFGVSVDFLSYRYLDVSVPCVRSLYTMYSCQSDLAAGFPHSDIHGSMLVHNSPQLFAVYHVLLRL